MPAAVSQSSSDIRRVAWSLLLAVLEEVDEGGGVITMPTGKARLLASQLTDPMDLPRLTCQLLDLSALLFTELHGDIGAARRHAAAIALELAAQ